LRIKLNQYRQSTYLDESYLSLYYSAEAGLVGTGKITKPMQELE